MKNKQDSLIQYIRQIPLGTKILLLIIVCLTLGFGSYVMYSLNSETAALKHQHRLRSHLFSETLIAGIRNIMLSGRTPYIRAFISEAREEFNEVGEFRLFNNKSEEIFPDKKTHISIPLQDSGIKESLSHNQYINNIYPLKNEKSCKVCHGDDSQKRGFLKINFTENANWEKALLEVVNNAFQTIMLSGKGEYADTLLMDINNLLGIDLIQVYDEEAIYVAFGNDNIEVNEDILEDILNEFHNSGDYKSTRQMGDYHFSPLPNLESCYVCHGTDSKLRGVLALGTQLQIQREQVINSVIIGFKNLMLLQSASYAGAYVDAIRNLPFVEKFQIFDNGQLSDKGYLELWVPNPDYESPELSHKAANLITVNNLNTDYKKNQLEYIENISDMNHLTQMVPILNDEKCQACHQPPDKDSYLYETQKDKWKVRSIVKVSTSMKDIQEEIQKNTKASIIVGFITLVLMALLLRVFMKITVLRPLDIIGEVADKIGEGDLSVNAKVKSQDEIGTLANRINAMIIGLQERYHLTKFVSEEAVSAVEKAGLEGLSLGGGRRETTVMETDIRGFTSISEKIEPEEVVNLINTYLDKQAEVIQNHGGDIDKFIGDAILAVFYGDQMADRAVSCAINIQKETQKLNKKLNKEIVIGIGLNTGPVIVGPVGSKDRMDFTVIGDNVNLAARLCDAAQNGEVIISNNTKEHLTENKFNLKKLDPYKAKGKVKLIKIFEVLVQ